MCGGIKTGGYEKEKSQTYSKKRGRSRYTKRIVTHWVLYPQKDHYHTKCSKTQDNGNVKKKRNTRYESHLLDQYLAQEKGAM